MSKESKSPEILSESEPYEHGEEITLYCSECNRDLAIYDVSGPASLLLFAGECPHFRLEEYPSSEWPPSPEEADLAEKVLDIGGRVYAWFPRQ